MDEARAMSETRAAVMEAVEELIHSSAPRTRVFLPTTRLEAALTAHEQAVREQTLCEQPCYRGWIQDQQPAGAVELDLRCSSFTAEAFARKACPSCAGTTGGREGVKCEICGMEFHQRQAQMAPESWRGVRQRLMKHMRKMHAEDKQER